MQILRVRSIGLFLLAGLLFVPFALAHDGSNPVERSLSYNSLDRTVLHYQVKDYNHQTVTINGKEYQSLSLPDCAFFRDGEAGQPQLPRLSESLLIPDTARMAVKVLKSEYHEITGVDVAPSKGTIYRTVDPASVPYVFGPEYKENAFFPGNLAEARDPYILHDVRAMVVDLYPFQYNPVTRVLRVYDVLDVEVATAGKAEKNILDRSNAKIKVRPSDSFEHVYANLFGNYAGNRTDPPGEDGDMLIISYGPFMSAVQALVDWKNSIGINTTMVDVATIGNNATAIKTYIKNLYNSSNLTFVLLVGDIAQVASNSYSGTVSDPDYSTITADWYPDLFIGRFSAETLAQAQTQVDRTINYEQEGHDVGMGGWNAAALGVASNQGSGIGHYGESDDQHLDLLMGELSTVGFTTITKSYDYWGTKTIITNALNAGVRVVDYCGHGSVSGWANGGGYVVSDVNNLVNDNMLPFVCSVACNVGEFDAGTCFCEAWLRATHNGQPTGGIAHYGSTISQSWAPPMYAEGNHSKSGKYGALERFCNEMNWSVGAEFFGGSCCMMDIAGSSGQAEFRAWTVFGDPSLRVYGAFGPQTLTADSSSISISTPVQIHLTVDPGAAYAGYKYAVLSGLSGTSPGTTIPGGVEVPLNFDVWTYWCMGYLNQIPLLQNFLGYLDGNGQATATLDTTGLTPLDPRVLGFHIYFAAIVWPAGKPFEMATNAKAMTFVP